MKDRLPHIDQFSSQIMSNQIITQQIYQFDTTLGGILEKENFPIFFLFEKIYSAYEVLSQSKLQIDTTINLTKLIMEGSLTNFTLYTPHFYIYVS